MRLFVDASAIIAIIENEPDRAMLLDRLQSASHRMWSAMSCWEAVSGLQNAYQRPISTARPAATMFAETFGLAMRPIGEAELGVALDAYDTYGKGRHPARLNFGDCFSYACAKTNDAALLYKGGDFARTDLAWKAA